jgi:quinol monooxygenase YgiN
MLSFSPLASMRAPIQTAHLRNVHRKEHIMVKLALFVRLEAKPGKEAAVAELLAGAQTLARQEAATVTWYAFRLGPRSFGIFDTFNDEAGRKAHLAGLIAQALLGKADELLATPPNIQMVDLVAVK